jgi:Ca2+-binding EF-hand superfamily protein
VAAFGDGDVSKNALVRFLDQVWEIRRGRAEHIFAELDKDGDGHLSKEEFDEAAKQYLFSTKYNAVGALLFREVDS